MKNEFLNTSYTQAHCLIVSNFTTDPIIRFATYSATNAGLNIIFQLAAFDQIMQVLLTLPIAEKSKINYILILIKVDRWINNSAVNIPQDLEDKIEAFCNAAIHATLARGFQLILVICPVSPDLRNHDILTESEHKILDKVRHLGSVKVISRKDFDKHQSVSAYADLFDKYTEKSASMPYSDACFALIATLIVRTLYNQLTKPRKVIVVDCDETLWSGVSAENEPSLLTVTQQQGRIQAILIEQVLHGRLLCLCSKNSIENVKNVFITNKHMLLRWEHFTTWRINWHAKSDNLRDMAKELSLSLDSFVFIDDDVFECEAIKNLLPEVLTIHLDPSNHYNAAVLEGIWALDFTEATKEDESRLRYYRENTTRNEVKQKSTSIEEFIASLKVVLTTISISDAEIPRSTQLAARVNQFNLNGRFWKPNELKSIITDGFHNGLVFHARDRFGDYGDIGLIIYYVNSHQLHISTLLLSCRALGKGLEPRIAAKIAAIAESHKTDTIAFEYKPTNKNALILSFLNHYHIIKNGDFWMVGVKLLNTIANNGSAIKYY